MTAVEELEQEAYDQNIPVDYVKFKSDHLHGLYIDGSIAIHSGLMLRRQQILWPRSWSIIILPTGIF